MLLASGRDRVSVQPPSRRNKRKNSAPNNKGTKGGALEDSTTESKVSAETKNLDGGSVRRRGYKRSNKDRKPNRGAKGTDRTIWRSASELDIEWIGDYCPDSSPHILIGKHNFNGGSLFKCQHCKKHVWLPTYIRDAAELDSMIGFFGARAGYRRFLDKHPESKIVVAKLQDLWYARQRIEDKEEFAKLVISVMEDKEYGKKETAE